MSLDSSDAMYAFVHKLHMPITHSPEDRINMANVMQTMNVVGGVDLRLPLLYERTSMIMQSKG